MSIRTFYPLPPGPSLRTDYWKEQREKTSPQQELNPRPTKLRHVLHPLPIDLNSNPWTSGKTRRHHPVVFSPNRIVAWNIFLTRVSGANEIYVDDLHTKIKHEKEPLFISHFIFFQQFFSWGGVTLIGDSCFCCSRRRRQRRRRHQRHVEWNQILIKFVFQISAKGLPEFSKWHPRALWGM